MSTRPKPFLCIAALLVAALACSAPTPTPTLPTATPYAAPTTPAPEPSPMPTAATPPPTTPPSGWLPANTIALYSAGLWESRPLYALAADGSSTDLALTVYPWTAISPSGRWIARPNGPSPADGVLITNLETAATHTVPAAAGFDVYGIGFAPDETRLAFLEMGGLEPGGANWAIVVVNLADLSTARFEVAGGEDPPLMPGIPLGWSSADNLLIDTFPPYSEWAPLGIWGITLPPGTPGGPFSALTRHELLPSGSYAAPRFSPDRSRILYMARTSGYTPAGYEPVAYDMAVNQLWMVDISGATPTLLLEITDGGALSDDADWSPDGTSILFAAGTYAGDTFATLTLKIRDSAGGIRDVTALPLPANGYPDELAWCRPNLAIYTTMAMDGSGEIYLIDLVSGSALLVNAASAVSVLGCVP